MNLFYLDEDLDKNAEYHVDSHVVKMPLEAAQILTTAIWVDHLLGFVPRALTKDELLVLKEFKANQPPIEERTFTRFLPTHPNHPCTIWARSSMDNFEWTYSYADALNSEYCFRYRHEQNHKAFDAVNALPAPKHLPRLGLTPHAQAMPDDYKDEDPIAAYRMYYMMEKADFAVWKRREKPIWWDDKFVEYMGRDPHECYLNTVKAPNNRNKPHSRDYEHVKN